MLAWIDTNFQSEYLSMSSCFNISRIVFFANNRLTGLKIFILNKNYVLFIEHVI